MESQQLQSKMRSCASLDDALKHLKNTEKLPDDPVQLQAFIEDPMVCWVIFQNTCSLIRSLDKITYVSNVLVIDGYDSSSL